MKSSIDIVSIEISKNQKTRNIYILVGILLAITIRIFFLWVPSWDIYIQSKWYDELIDIGRIDAFKEVFYQPYTPASVYLIDIMTLFRFIPKEQAIKIIPIFFDFLGAWGFFKIIKHKFPQNDYPIWGFFAFLFLPTVFIESGMWGQFDIVFTSFLIWSFFYILSGKSWHALFWFSVALCIKLQAMFIAPLFLILLLNKKIKFYQFIIVPIVYVISILPAWIISGKFKELLSIYINQFDTFNQLSKRAPNFYIYLNSDKVNYQVMVIIGLVVSFLFVLFYIAYRWLKNIDMSDEQLVFDAALFTFVLPFVLPKMHDRYFYVGCIFILLLCFFNIKAIGILGLCQIGSLMAYIPYFSGWEDIFVMIAAPFMLAAIIWLIMIYQQFVVGKKIALQLRMDNQ